VLVVDIALFSAFNLLSVSEPLVTVVTPVYNGERHLAECIESVLKQTYENWEYVIVDNTSTDGTPEIARDFAKRDSRIRYERHDVFVEVIGSFNRAIGAVGDDSVYCKPLGADDWLFPECLSKMVEIAENNPTVGVVGGYRLNGRTVDLTHLPYWQTIQPGRDVIAADTWPSSTGTPTALLFRADIVRERTPFYDPTFRHADTEAAYWALLRSDYGIVHQVVTYNREVESPESVTSNRIESYAPDRIRWLIRYGPLVLPSDVYRTRLRAELQAYARLMLHAFVGWHTKRRFKNGLARNEDFHAYHLRAVELISAEGPEDRDVQRTVRFARKLLEWY
jgi:glycosyltransferase involved in cell wall biosynthesis